MKRKFRIGKLGNGGLRIRLGLTIRPKLLTIQIDGSPTQLRIISLDSWSISQAQSGRIGWDDSDDSIYFSQTSGEGNVSVSVNSDENTGYRRTRDIEIVATDDKGKTQSKLLTIYQYGVYDGKYATTPQGEYIKALDGGDSNSKYNMIN